jgi:predicted DsbA family dithiol-disulfide isomerase
MSPLKIDFVSDIACPWCAVGLASLEQAIARLGDKVSVSLHFQPFELNPDMPPEGEDIVEHLMRKYRINAEQVAQNHEHIRERGAAVGFNFNLEGRQRTWNTFDAHRLLHWAGEQDDADAQRRLKWLLLSAYFSEGRNPSSREVLLAVAEQAGLDVNEAAAILDADTWRDEVRQQQQFYLSQGIHSVPAVIINDRHLVQGGQPPEVFEQALRQIAAES